MFGGYLKIPIKFTGKTKPKIYIGKRSNIFKMPKRGLNLPRKRMMEIPAPLLKRIFSYVIDLFIINIIIITPFSSVLKKIIPTDLGTEEVIAYVQSNPGLQMFIIKIFVLIGILAVLYFTFFEYKAQQTPGKMLMREYIKPESGKELSFWSYLISNLTFIPIFPFIILWVIDPIHMFLSPKNQRLMERLTGIIVVEKYEMM